MGVEQKPYDGVIGEGLSRRNSNLKISNGQHGAWVEKSYHARFTVQDEYQAYQSLTDLFSSVAGVRLATVHKMDTASSTIWLEYIAGPNLMEAFLQRGVSAFIQSLNVLVNLFSKAKTHQLQFDSDPTNFMLESGSEMLVLVDPVSAEVQLEDFCMVVFLWGFIKCFIRSRALHRFSAFWKCWKMYYAKYIQVNKIESKDLNGQLSKYIDVVIGWNRTESQQESWWKRMARLIIVVPAWRLIQQPFKRNWVTV